MEKESQEEVVGENKDAAQVVENETSSCKVSVTVWRLYKAMLAFPAETNGWERKIGVALYVLCLVVACGMVIGMITGSEQSYTNYKTEIGTSSRAAKHRVPDIVACPAEKQVSEYKFNVLYNEMMIKNILKMSADEVDEITTKKFQKCPRNGGCLEIKEVCEGKFAKYCKELNRMVQRGKAGNFSVNTTELSLGELASFQKAFLYKRWEANGKKWSLDMLWSSIISLTYLDQHPLYRTFITFPPFKDFLRSRVYWAECPLTVECFGYGSTGHFKESEACMMLVRNIWVGASYCGYISGSRLNQTDSPYIGFSLRVPLFDRWSDQVTSPMKFWMGSLENSEINEENFISSNNFDEGYKFMDTVSSVIHYSMVEFRDETKLGSQCLEQPLIAGAKVPCDQQSGKENAKWFYEFNYQNRPLRRVWIYAKTKQIVTKKASFTTYTQMQFGASLFACFVGLSIMQIMQVILSYVVKVMKAGETQRRIFQLFIFTALLLLSVILTTMDMNTYFQNRYSTVFKEKPVETPVPMVQICNDWYSSFGFVNNSRFRDFNVSLTFATYLRYVGFQLPPYVKIVYQDVYVMNDNKSERFVKIPEWMTRNFENGLQSMNNCSIPNRCEYLSEPLEHFIMHYITPDADPKEVYQNQNKNKINIETHEKASEQMRREAQDLWRKLGKLGEASITELMEPFFLDPKILIKHCSIVGVAFDCWKYARYMFETGSHEVCLVLDIPKEELKSRELVGVDSALTVSYDVDEYRKNSDIVSYYGPDVTREMMDENATCTPSEVLPEGWFKTVHGCSAARSWKLKVAHPERYTQFIQIQLSEQGLAVSDSHIFEIRMNFQENLKELKLCYEPDEIACTYPKEEMMHLSKALQLHIWCKCAYCFKKDLRMLSTLSSIIGEEASCCTITQLTKCYTGYMQQITIINDTYQIDEAYNIFSEMAFDVSGGKHGIHFANLDELQKPSYGWFKKVFRYSDQVGNETIQRFLNHMTKCFRIPCNHYTLELYNYQNEKIDDGFVNVTVFYGTNEGVGIEEVDRLNPVDFVAILLCGYSVTFGIGIVGLFELVYMLVKQLRGKPHESSAKVVHDHLMKAAAILVDERSATVAPAESPTDIAKDPSENDKKKSKVIQINARQDHGAEADAGPSKGFKEAEMEDGKKKADKAAVETVENSTSDPNSSHMSSGFLMNNILLCATLIMLLLMGYFFWTTDKYEYNADVIAAPKIQKPSLVMCVNSPEKSQQLYNALAKSKCQVHGSNNTNCYAYFTIFVRNGADRFCYIWDNSHAPETPLNQQTKDLILDVTEDMPEVRVSVQGFSRTLLENVSPYLKWTDQNMLMGYTTKLKKLSSDCETTEKTGMLGKCPSGYQEKSYPFFCGVAAETMSPRTPQRPCLWVQYSVALVYSESERAKNRSGSIAKRLEVKANQNNVLVLSVKTKLGGIQLLSIVGGFVGSFIEFTILSLLSVIFLPLLSRFFNSHHN